MLFQEQNIESFSSLGGEVITIYEKYTIQLINKKGEVVDEQKDVKKFSFQKIRPGTYYLRVLIDENKDGIFERGSLLDKVRPEKVHQHPQKIILKANWEINDEKIIF
ncbi:MAG: hypothetical protein GY827_07730 [Cytophagales bacterium]|nr:hypothetical protein [Cytophagales bacterium]